MPSAATSESRVPFWAWAALPVVLAAWLRIRGIGGPEPFVDEAGSIIEAFDLRLRALVNPLGEGRPALAHLYLPAGWWPAHALETARLMSAGAGLATLAALGWSLHRLAGRAAALAGLWLWAVAPFMVFHERLVLQDPFVTALLAGAVALTIAGSQAEKKRAGWFLAAGGLFGTAFLFKISAVFALLWLGLFYAVLQRHLSRPVFSRQLIFIAAGAVLPLLCLGSDLLQLGQQSARFDSLPSLAADNYWGSTLQRLKLWGGWYAGYGGWPLGLLWLGALILAWRARSWPALGGALGSVLSIFVAALFYNRPFARYALPDQLPLILFLALAWGPVLGRAGRLRAVALPVFALALAGWGMVAWQIGTAPLQAAIPPGEIAQYFTGPWSGRGLGEVRRYLTDYADRHQVRCLVLTHRFLRPGCYGLLLAELGDPRIGVVPYTVYEPGELATAFPVLRRAAAGRPAAFFLLFEGSIYPAHPWLDQADGPAQRVLTIPRGEGESFTLYQFTP